MGESSPERNFLIPSRPMRNVGPPNFYSKRLFVDVIGEQASGTADNTFTLSDVISDTVSDVIFENERDCREILVAQSIEQPSPIVSQNPTEIVPETRTFTEEEVQELLTSSPPSVVEDLDDSEISTQI